MFFSLFLSSHPPANLRRDDYRSADRQRNGYRCIISVLYFCLIKHGFPLSLLGHAIFKVTYLSNHDYKPLYFESDAATVNEIVLKVSSGWMSVLFLKVLTI